MWVDHPVRPVGEGIEEALPVLVRLVLQGETAGALSADDCEALLVVSVKVGLEERAWRVARDTGPTDEAVIGVLLEEQLGLLNPFVPGITTHSSPFGGGGRSRCCPQQSGSRARQRQLGQSRHCYAR